MAPRPELTASGRFRRLTADAGGRNEGGPVSSRDRHTNGSAELFPDHNPNPVLRMDRSGVLTYANPASRVIVRDLALVIGEPIPSTLARPLADALADADSGMAEVEVTSVEECEDPA